MGAVAFPSLGYSIVPDVLSHAECNTLCQALDAPGVSRRAGTRHLMLHPEVAAVANSEKLLRIARRCLGEPDAVAFRATLFNKTSKATG
jgi:hypothetical protein